jgi:ATP-binding cassette subfamily B protein
MFKKFPFYKQPDQMDCGPTCLRMVAAYHGKRMPLQQLREWCDTGKLGSSLFQLKVAAEKTGFTADAYRLSYGSLVKQKLPCIALWNKHHYVVIYKIKQHQVYIADPAHGLLQYDLEDFLHSWSGENSEGIILTLQPEPNFKHKGITGKNNEGGLTHLFRHLFKFKKLGLQLAIGLLIGSFLQLLFPFLTQSIVDNGIQHHDLNFIYLALLAQLLLFIGRTSTDVIRSWILLHISSRVNILITGDFFNKLMKLPVSYFDRKMNGDIMQRIDDNQRVEYFLTSWSLNMFFGLVTLVVFSVVLGH